MSADVDGLEEEYRGNNNITLDQATPSLPPLPVAVDNAATASAAVAFPDKRAPSHESSDYGGGGGADGGSVGWTGTGHESLEGGAGPNRRRSWAGQSGDDLGGGEDDLLGLRRASSGDQGGQVRHEPDGPVAVGSPADARPPRGEISEGGVPWPRREDYRHHRQEGEDVAGNGSGEGGDSAAEGEGYGEGDLYERDLENAVAMLENGGFLLDGDQAEAWRSESFSSSTAGDGHGGGEAGEKQRKDGTGSEHGGEEMRFATAAHGQDGYAGEQLGTMARDDGGEARMMGGAADGNGRGRGSGSNAWGQLRTGSRRPFAAGGDSGGGYDDDEPEAEPVRTGVVAHRGDGTAPPLQRNHSFVFGETSTDSAGAANGPGATLVGAPGR